MHDTEIRALIENATLQSLTWPNGKDRGTLERRGDAGEALRQLCTDRAVPHDTRFKACEALLTLGAQLQSETEKISAAEAYAAALASATTHNAWSLPGELRSSATSRNLLSLGRHAIPALRPLLEDSRELLYEGSEEPTISEMHDYRVRDLAASFVAEILGESFPAELQDADARAKVAQQLYEQTAPGSVK